MHLGISWSSRDQFFEIIEEVFSTVSLFSKWTKGRRTAIFQQKYICLLDRQATEEVEDEQDHMINFYYGKTINLP